MNKTISPATKLDLICEELKQVIERAYNEGTSMPEAEKIAARTLTVRLELADEIKRVSLDAKMKKHGVKAVRAEVYLSAIEKSEKKPTEGTLEALINVDEQVAVEERLYAESDSEERRLVAYLDVFKDAHLYFRQICKGTFEG